MHRNVIMILGGIFKDLGRLKDVLHRYSCIAFMFNGGQLPALTIHPIELLTPGSARYI